MSLNRGTAMRSWPAPRCWAAATRSPSTKSSTAGGRVLPLAQRLRGRADVPGHGLRARRAAHLARAGPAGGDRGHDPDAQRARRELSDARRLRAAARVHREHAALTGFAADAAVETTPPHGKRGESCEASNDCEQGLACIGSRCLESDFDLDYVPKECYRVQCATSDDCCADFKPEAATPRTSATRCAATARTRRSIRRRASSRRRVTSNDCYYWTQSTAAARFDCVSGAVRDACRAEYCLVDGQCTTGPATCVDNHCVECTTSTDCSSIAVPVLQRQRLRAVHRTTATAPPPARAACRARASRAARRTSTAACSRPARRGECVDVGCTSDRQCYFLTGDDRSRCVADQVPDAVRERRRVRRPVPNLRRRRLRVRRLRDSDEECRAVLGLDDQSPHEPGPRGVPRARSERACARGSGSLAAVWPSVAGAGCGTKVNVADARLSEAGESCEAQSDCAEGLACVDLVCRVSDTQRAGSTDGGPGRRRRLWCRAARAGSARAAARRADCGDGLPCFERTCRASESPGADGGPAQGRSRRELRGEQRLRARHGLHRLRCAASATCSCPHDRERVPPRRVRGGGRLLPDFRARGPDAVRWSSTTAARPACNPTATCTRASARAAESATTRSASPASTCSNDLDCGGSGVLRCFAGKCAQCASDSDCTGGAACVGGLCRAGCERNEECPIFSACIRAPVRARRLPERPRLLLRERQPAQQVRRPRLPHPVRRATSPAR